jgi:hypothetical protein
MHCGRPNPGRSIARPGFCRPQGVFGVLNYYQSLILFVNIVRLIMEFTLIPPCYPLIPRHVHAVQAVQAAEGQVVVGAALHQDGDHLRQFPLDGFFQGVVQPRLRQERVFALKVDAMVRETMVKNNITN